MCKRILTTLLLFSLIFPFTFGCQSGEGEVVTNNYNNETFYITIADDNIRVYPELPEIKYGGVEIGFIGTGKAYGGGYYQTKDVFVEAMNGEPFNDAIYERNRNIEEQYEVVIKYSDSDDVYSTIMKSVAAGDYVCDIAFGSWANMVNLGLGNYLMDLSEVKHIDLEKPWWDQNATNRTAIANKVYYTTGELSTLDNSCTRMVYFNKNMISDFSLEVPYDLVDNNGWVLDKFISMSKSVYADLNGDGVANEGDRFGTFRESGYYDFLFIGCGMDYVTLDINGKPEISFLDNRTFTMIDKIFDFLYDEKACIDLNTFKDNRGFQNVYAYARSMFADDKLLFTIGGPLVIVEFRDMESDFGIVPLPKYDSEQERYYTYVDAGTNMIGVPSTTADIERTGVIMEAMAAESMYVITPVYNETLLKRKYSRDNESEAMLDLINDSRVYCLKLVHNIGGIASIMANAYAANRKPSMSDYDAVKDASNVRLEELYESYIE